MRFGNLRQYARLREGAFLKKWFLAILCCVALALAGQVSFAVEAVGKFQVIHGTEDKAYLVDTTTGFAWVLTYRTTATGREPIALPYKFIKICPTNQKSFLVEDAETGACLPPGRDGKK